MSTFTQIIYQIVFSTQQRQPVLTEPNRVELFKYIHGILRNKKCHLYRVNGVEDHIHILTDLHPTISLAALVKDIKLASSQYIKERNLFPGFSNWQEGYGAFTYSIDQKNTIIEYIKNQETHHQVKTFREEYIALLKENQIEFDEKYLI